MVLRDTMSDMPSRLRACAVLLESIIHLLGRLPDSRTSFCAEHALEAMRRKSHVPDIARKHWLVHAYMKLQACAVLFDNFSSGPGKQKLMSS